MRKNIGNGERVIRALVSAGLLACGVMSPLPLPVRLVVFGVSSLYVALTALGGTCAGYALLGKSTCSIQPRS